MSAMPTTAPRRTSALRTSVVSGRETDLRELFRRWQDDRDEAARDVLVTRFMPLARSLARRYDRSSEPFEDLLQVASLGLIKALDRFDIERGHAFASFAVPTILGELKRYFRDSGWAVHVPRGPQERALKVEQARQQLTTATGPAADRLRAGRVPGAEHRGRARRAGGRPGLRRAVARRAAAVGERRCEHQLRRALRRRGGGLRADRGERHRRRRTVAPAGARARACCTCASSRT